MRGRRLPEWPLAPFLGEAPCRFGTSKRPVADADAVRTQTDHACGINDSADREPTAAGHFAHEVIKPLPSHRRAVLDRASLLKRKNEVS